VRLAYLGPAGSFTESAARRFPAAGPVRILSCPTVEQVLLALRSGSADAAVVPLENSVEGAVTPSVDALVRQAMTGAPLPITGETLLQVSFALAVPAGAHEGEVDQIVTHPHAYAQCRSWLEEHYPRARFVPASSTAEAARVVAQERQPGAAAIASSHTAVAYGLRVRHHDIGDRPDTVTRFVRVGPVGTATEPTGSDRTTLLVEPRGGVKGLRHALDAFARTSVALTSVLPRPTGEVLGAYYFLVECEGHIADRPVTAAYVRLKQTATKVRLLGSYPRAHRPAPSTTSAPTNTPVPQPIPR
jgi:prephenate dehydratase